MAYCTCSIDPVVAAAGVFLVRGVALGLGAAVPIGPVNVQIARRALCGRFGPGAALGCGAVTADVTYAALSSLSLARLLNRPLAVNLIGVAGALLLTWLGISCLGAAVAAWRSDPIAAAENADNRSPAASRSSHTDALHSSYLTGLFMTLLNPMTLAFWFTVVPATTAVADSAPAAPTRAIVTLANSPAAGSGTAGPTTTVAAKLMQERTSNLPITCAGVFVGTLTWVVLFSGLLALVGRRRRNGWLAAADATGGATLLFFAAVMVWRLMRPHV